MEVSPIRQAKIAIVGAGLAGLSCAAGLVERGHAVTLFDKGRGPGGRTSTRRMSTPDGDVQFDHGAPCFEAHDPDFRAQVDRWLAQGVVARWPAAGEAMWLGVPGMNALTRAGADGHDVRFGHHVSGIARRGTQWHVQVAEEVHGPYDALVLAIPAEQAAPLLGLHDFAMAREALGAASLPCWTVMASFDQPLPGPDLLMGRNVISRAIRNSAKPGRSGPEAWVIHASAAWSRKHLEDDAASVTTALLAALGQKLGVDLPAPALAAAHRWRFALPKDQGHPDQRAGNQAGNQAYKGALWNGALALGACGDWLLGPTVEQAWLSGRRLALLMAGQRV